MSYDADTGEMTVDEYFSAIAEPFRDELRTVVDRYREMGDIDPDVSVDDLAEQYRERFGDLFGGDDAETPVPYDEEDEGSRSYLAAAPKAAGMFDALDRGGGISALFGKKKKRKRRSRDDDIRKYVRQQMEQDEERGGFLREMLRTDLSHVTDEWVAEMTNPFKRYLHSS